MYKLLAIALVSLFGLLQCEVSSAAERKLQVTVTTGIIADLVRNVGGEKVEVRALMGPGVDPHLYKATHGDLGLLSNADIVFFNGLHLEGKMQEIFEGLKKRKPVFAVSEKIDHSKLRQPPEFAGLHDPHIWFNAALWSETIPVVRDELARLAPADGAYFAEHADKYRAELAALHEWVMSEARTIPEKQRVLITAHDAFGYFGEAYSFQVAGLQGVSTATEFGLADIQRLTDLIISRHIKAIFVETSVPQRFILSIQQGVEAKGKTVAVGGTLYSDALGEPGSGADTYQGMVRANVKTIVGALK